MSMNASFVVFNQKKFDEFWGEAIKTNLDISVIQWVDNFASIVRDVKSGRIWEEGEIEDKVLDIFNMSLDSLMIESSSLSIYTYSEIYEVLNSLCRVTVNEEFSGWNQDVISVDVWRGIVKDSLSREEIEQRKSHDSGITSETDTIYELNKELAALLDKAEHTNSELHLLTEDRLSHQWVNVLYQNISAKLKAVLLSLRPDSPTKKFTGDPRIDRKDEKWFYEPIIFIETRLGRSEIVYVDDKEAIISRSGWSGSVNPGEELKNSVASELDSLFDYQDSFSIGTNMKFIERRQDNNKIEIPTYRIFINLENVPVLEKQIFGFRPMLLLPLE